MGNRLMILPAFLAAMMLCLSARSAEQFGTVDDMSGSASVTDSSGQSSPAAVGRKIFEAETLNTGPDGEVHIVTEDGGIIALRPDTAFHIDEYKAEGGSADKIIMSLFQGAIRSITGWIGKHNASSYLITTPTATIGIRGTDHEVTVIDNGNGDQPGTYETVNSGSTVLKTLQGEVEVKPGKFAFAPRDRKRAPFLLAQRPNFYASRRLRIEKRIPQRRDYLHGRLELMRKERIRHMKETRRNHAGQFKERGSEVEVHRRHRRDSMQ
jgi:hypothetical protein